MIKHIKLIPFLVGVVIGIIAVIFGKPEQNVVYKYPNPKTAKNMIYKDKNGICYRYMANQVDCDKNEAKLKEFPISK